MNETMIPKISVCIPSYNRSRYLPDLLDSIVSQSYQNFEIVISEDMSQERGAIREIVHSYQQRNPGLIKYYENETNKGYDENLRTLFERASGDYCFIMGNDDLMCENALALVGNAVNRYPNVGVILRTYASFFGSPANIDQTHRYFPEECFFPAGQETIITFFYRLVVMSGIVLNRESAIRYRTEKFDGTLFYQLHVAANILLDMNGVFLPTVLVLCRMGEAPEFGNSSNERGLFTPGVHTPEMDLRMLKGILTIARETEIARHVLVYKPILEDIGNYSYATLAFQSGLPLNKFIRYYWKLCQIGLWNNLFFHAYFLAILTFGPARIKHIIRFLRKKMGHTPMLGRRHSGRPYKDMRHSDGNAT